MAWERHKDFDYPVALEATERMLAYVTSQSLEYRNLLQIMLDPENRPPQFTVDEAWEKFKELTK